LLGTLLDCLERMYGLLGMSDWMGRMFGWLGSVSDWLRTISVCRKRMCCWVRRIWGWLVSIDDKSPQRGRRQCVHMCSTHTLLRPVVRLHR
jgi:hypothetical protein